jgi:hypothetical protein
VRTLCICACALISCSNSSSPAGSDRLPGGVRAAVHQHHGNASRSGLYVDPAMTRDAVRHLRQDGAFDARYAGPVHAQPLYWDGGEGGQDLLLVFTEQNEVIALDPISGARVWSRTLAPPAARLELPCGNISPLGITGTPVIDPARKLIFLDAMVAGAKHRVYTLSVVDGSVVGSPVDLDGSVSGFTSQVQNQRGALALMGDILYVPYGAHEGDCGNFSGWVVGIDTTGATAPKSVRFGLGAGVWAVPGIAVADGALWVATGNSYSVGPWIGGEGILRLTPGPAFSQATRDFYTPVDWAFMDDQDLDLGSSGAVPVDVAGRKLVAALGKDGSLHLADRDDLGGIGGFASGAVLSTGPIITAPAMVPTADGALVVWTGRAFCSGSNGPVIAAQKVTAPPLQTSTAWCVPLSGRGAPIATTIDGTAEAIAWAVGAEGDRRVYAYDALTGQSLFGGGQVEMTRFNAPIVAKGRLYVAGNNGAYAFTVR